MQLLQLIYSLVESKSIPPDPGFRPRQTEATEAYVTRANLENVKTKKWKRVYIYTRERASEVSLSDPESCFEDVDLSQLLPSIQATEVIVHATNKMAPEMLLKPKPIDSTRLRHLELLMDGDIPDDGFDLRAYTHLESLDSNVWCILGSNLVNLELTLKKNDCKTFAQAMKEKGGLLAHLALYVDDITPKLWDGIKTVASHLTSFRLSGQLMSPKSSPYDELKKIEFPKLEKLHVEFAPLPKFGPGPVTLEMIGIPTFIKSKFKISFGTIRWAKANITETKQLDTGISCTRLEITRSVQGISRDIVQFCEGVKEIQFYSDPGKYLVPPTLETSDTKCSWEFSDPNGTAASTVYALCTQSEIDDDIVSVFDLILSAKDKTIVDTKSLHCTYVTFDIQSVEDLDLIAKRQTKLPDPDQQFIVRTSKDIKNQAKQKIMELWPSVPDWKFVND